jgi:hypothetical protein
LHHVVVSIGQRVLLELLILLSGHAGEFVDESDDAHTCSSVCVTPNEGMAVIFTPRFTIQNNSRGVQSFTALARFGARGGGAPTLSALVVMERAIVSLSTKHSKVLCGLEAATS